MTNKVELIGKVAEIEVREGKTKKEVPYVSGTIKIETSQDNIIPVDFFAQKVNAKGNESPLYKSLLTVAKDYKSIADVGREEASIVKIDSGEVIENIFSPDGTGIFRGFKINSNFFNRKTEEPMNKFTIEGIFLNAREEIEKDVPTGTLIVSLLYLGYENAPHVLDFYVSNPAGVEYIKNTVSEGQLIKFAGKVIVSEEITEKTETAAFGEPIVTYSRKISRRLEVSSAGAPVDAPHSMDDIQKFLATREGNITTIKANAAAKNTSSAQSKPAASNFSL